MLARGALSDKYPSFQSLLGPTLRKPPRMRSYRKSVQVAVGTLMTPLVATVTGKVDLHAILPTLPAGLVANVTSAIISGVSREI
jgi:hypothetical protein